MGRDAEKGRTILLVDDDDFFRERLGRAFVRRGFTVLEAGNYDQAVEVIEREKPPLAVFDLKMPGHSGLELIKKAKDLEPGMRILVLTGYGSIATAMDASRLGAVNYLPKPADVDDIIQAFARDPEVEIDTEQQEFNAPSLARMEWEHINRVLSDCGGNISAAAKRLGLHRRTLQRKLYKYAPKE